MSDERDIKQKGTTKKSDNVKKKSLSPDVWTLNIKNKYNKYKLINAERDMAC